MRVVLLFFLSLAATAVTAQDFDPDFYAGVLGGAGPTFTTPGEHWDSDTSIFSAGAFAGVNLRSGNAIYGLELGFSHDFGKTSLGEWYHPNSIEALPRFAGTGTCWGCSMPPSGVEYFESAGGMAADEILSYSFLETLLRTTLSARLGLQHENWTLYGKAGLGIAQQRHTEVTDATGTINCQAIAEEVRWSGISGGETRQEYWQTACLNPQRGEITTETREFWSPTFVYGLGAEYDFEQYFLRGEVEMTHILDRTSSVRANLGFGIRF